MQLFYQSMSTTCAHAARRLEGKPFTVGGRTYSPDDIKMLSEGTHPLQDYLPEIDESVDPWDVEALKAMHPWLVVS